MKDFNKLIFQHKTNVRIDDINFGKHLDYSKISIFFHNLRALFLNVNNLSEINCFGVCLVVLNSNIDYKNQAYYNDQLLLSLYYNYIAGVKISFSYKMENLKKDVIIATGSTLMATLNPQKQKLVKPPKQMIDFFSHYEPWEKMLT